MLPGGKDEEEGVWGGGMHVVGAFALEDRSQAVDVTCSKDA